MKKSILISILSLLIFACNEHHHSGDTEFRLNNGQKWIMNEEMKPHIQNAELILTDYVSNGSQDAKKMMEELRANNQHLIQSCTMEGEAHEELHKWLYRHMQLIDNLETADSETELNQGIAEIEKSFKTFHEYFD